MHIREERKLLLGFSAVFLVIVLVMFGYGMSVDAEEIGLGEYKYNFVYNATADYSSYTYDYAFDAVSRVPVYGVQDVDSQGRLDYIFYCIDMENKAYTVANHTSVASNIYVNTCSKVYQEGTNNPKTMFTYGAMSFDVMPERSTYAQLTLNKGYMGECSVPLFNSKDSMENYIETGDTSGMISSGETPPRDFSGDYDPDVPIPQLTNLSHNGFTVANASQLLELDCVVQSYSYGLKHTPKKTLEIGGFKNPFSRDNDWVLNSHYYDCTSNSEIGYTTDVYNLSETFGCSNANDLYADVQSFFDSYPKHSDLPDYDWWNYGGIQYKSAYDEYVSLFASDGVGADDASKCLNHTESAMTKYYVRFYELKESELTPGSYVMTPGQWYCYTYCAGESDGIGVSPVVGDSNGNPIETDPIWGSQNPDGSPDYGSGGGSLPDVDISNPLSMLQDFINLLTSLPDMVGELNLFFQQTFCFIPEKYWTLILAGVGFSVVFLIFNAIK